MPLSSKIIKSVDNSLEQFSIGTKKICNKDEKLGEYEDLELLKDAKAEANKILQDAQENATSLVEKTKENIKKIEKEAYEKAYNEAFEQGKKEAWDFVNLEAKKIYASCKEVLGEIQEIKNNLYQETEKDMVELVIDLAEKVVSKQLDIDKETIVEIVKDACEEKRDAQLFVIYANPEEIEILREKEEYITSELDPNSKIRIIADSNVELGGCYIENEAGYVDASLKTRLENLEMIIKSDIV